MLLSITFTQALLWLANGCLLAVFALAGVSKLRDINLARKSLIGFGVPERWSRFFVICLAVIEIAIAAMLAFFPTQQSGVYGVLVLLAIFTLAMAMQLLRGKRPTCACFGALAQSPISWKSVGRNILLMTLAISLIVQPMPLFVPSQTISLSSFVVMAWAALSASWLLHLTRQNGRLLLRIEKIERIEQIEQRDQTPTNTPPIQPQPLQPGMALPPLGLNDAHGRPFELRKFRGMQVLVLFLDANCAHCRPLIARLHDAPLANLYATNTAFVVISESESLRHQLPVEVTLLIDPGWRTMTMFGLRGTPAAAWVDAEGVLEQAAVHGTSAVKAVIDATIDRIAALSSAQSDPIISKQEEARHELATV